MGSVTPNKNLIAPTVNGDLNQWGGELNTSIAALDNILGNTATISTTSGTVTASSAQMQSLGLKFTGALVGGLTYNLVGTQGGFWVIENATSGAYSLTIGTTSGGTTVTVQQGSVVVIKSDGTNVVAASGPSGLIYCTDSGTASALVLATAGTPPSQGTGLSLVFNAANAVASNATANYNGNGAKNIYVPSGSGLVQVSANAWLAGQDVMMTYDASLNSSAGGWQVLGIGGSSGGVTLVAAGTGISVAGTTSVTVTNTGVTLLSAGTGIGLSGSTGAITITNTQAAAGAPQATYLTSGTGTYNVPVGALYLLVEMIGGGGGGGAANTNAGADGADSSFGSWVCKAGKGGPLSSSASVGGGGGSGGADGTGTKLADIAGGNGDGSYNNNNIGPAGGNSAFGGAGASVESGTSLAGLPAAANSGSGGGGATRSGSGVGLGGGAAQYKKFLITTPSSSYSYTVGAGGAGGAPGVVAGGNGGNGAVSIMAYFQ